MLTVRYEGSERTFAAGTDVVIGRDLRADVRVAHPLISRTHLIVRFDQGRWIAVDNGSLNGLYVHNRRVPVVDIQDGMRVNIGNPDGPALTFEVGRHQGSAGRPPLTTSIPIYNPASGPSGQGAHGQPQAVPHWPGQPSPPPPPFRQPAHPPSGPQLSHPPNGPQTRQPSGGHSMGPPTGPQQAPKIYRPQPVNVPPVPAAEPETSRVAEPETARVGDATNIATSMMKILRPGRTAAESMPGAIKIGRANDNDIVIPEVLASRHHATLIPTPQGTEIHDNRSINGTFVNGARVDSAVLHDGDVVTIGNIDLVFAGGTLARRDEAATATRTGGLDVRGVTWTIENNKTLLDDISLGAQPGTLTAVIGPSGAGKSTFARLVAGYTHPTKGTVAFEGHNVHAEYASLRSRIGMVPQDDVVHRQLTVNQALGYAAELRLPPDTSKADRAKVVTQVLEELDLTKHADTRVDKLSGGQRKRASVALELLTGPSLLILDEPTSGLDPALDHQVMLMLRQLADAGRVVIVVTHMLSYLDTCDQVLLVAPGGKTAYCGPPDQIGDAMGTTNWAKIFGQVGADPEEANRRFLEREQQPPPASADQPADLGEPVHTSVRRQISTVARRQVRLVVADRAYFVFLALLPFILGALSLTVPGTSGFHLPGPHADTPDESAQILALLLPAAAFMGTALTIRDLVGERAVFQREQAVGLSTTAYLLAKTAVFCGFAILQAAIVTAIVVIGKGAPTRGAVLLGNGTVELFAAVAATCVASAILGLAISSLVRSSEQIMPLFVVAVMAQLVLCGGMVPVTGRLGLDQLSWLMPARWGYAAASSTVDVRHLVPTSLLPQDRFWQHTRKIWLFDMGMLAALAVFYTGFVRWKIRLRR